MKRLSREELAALVANDLPTGAVVNLGIGMPTLVTDRLDPARGVQLHSENGILGMRLLQAHETADGDLINASKQSIALTEGAAIFDHVYSFSIMRGGHIDITVLGAFEVSCHGDLANWSLGADDPMPSVGGAMDLAVGARNVWVMMEALTREGAPRLRDRCALPLTGAGVVGRVYADIGVFDVRNGAFVPLALVDGLPPSGLDRWIDAPVRIEGTPRVLHPNS
ncbi:3-oxoadipate CoA-transferase [Achromobacter insolitus]|uniref:CoA-transferase n=1 Tax=Achromobacter insolitus TaxID=217204 RepID=UPI0007C794BE|nr:CoA-transferase [Achromobacter insolitus]OAE63874.1 3-oxoadipate CoA-transferase [Achromobacter insolitus]OCZ59770.1 3-oxoadipate CoA-transferase [Achromobacter insolitus]